MPDFQDIDDISERKAAFFSFLEPFSEDANRAIRRDRARLLAAERRFLNGPLGRREIRWLRQQMEAYGIEADPDAPLDGEALEKLELRMDIIPPSLALAQAALESGWGTSRFAQQGNNLFGIWCYEPGCGIVPERRPAGATYEVKSYPTPRQSFEDYMRNLNSNAAYRSLWLIREQRRLNGEPITGYALAEGLYRYSQEEWAYVSKVQNLILNNNLEKYDP